MLASKRRSVGVLKEKGVFKMYAKIIQDTYDNVKTNVKSVYRQTEDFTENIVVNRYFMKLTGMRSVFVFGVYG